MQRIQLFWRFLRYYWSAVTRYHVHSPFVYDFVEQVLEDPRDFYAFPVIERLRRKLLQDHTKIKITDYGAGSLVTGQRERSISSIAKYSATRPFFCRVLFRTVLHYQPQNMVELGTSLGISSLYQAWAASKSRFITLEGCPVIAGLAQRHFHALEMKHIEQLVGPFSETLPKTLQSLDRLDYVFIDGHHKYKPTVDYFELCLEKAHNDTVFIFDDIHWTKEMVQAWEEIKQHPRVKLSIDIFFFGIVFLREEFVEPIHMQLAPQRWKPWKLGFTR